MLPLPDKGVVLLKHFRREVRNECVAIMLSLQAVEAATDAKDQDRLWYAIRNVLISAANLSKICWGQGGKRQAERVAIRASIGVSDDSPLRPTRFRNHFEHYDERLEDWADATTHFQFIDKTVAVGGVREWIKVPLQDTDIFRSYDPVSGLLTFWGDSYDLAVIMMEAMRILAIVDTDD